MAVWRKGNSRRVPLTAAKADQSAALQLTLTDGTTLSPAEYVASLERAGKVTGARGGVESIGGYSAWVGKLAVAAQDGTSSVLVGAFIRTSPQTMYQLLGKSAQPDDEDFARIIATARSFRAVTDPALLAATPDRVRLRTVRPAGAFQTLLAAYGPQALDAEGTAILNNVQLDETIPAGVSLKIVVPGRTR